MRGGENAGLVAIGVERVFDDVVARDADGMHEQLAGERRQLEACANFVAVDHDGGFRAPAILDPGREHLSICANSRHHSRPRFAP